MIIQAIKSTCSQQRQRNCFLGTSTAHLTIISENMHHNIPWNLVETQSSTLRTSTTLKPSPTSPKCCQIFITTWKWPLNLPLDEYVDNPQENANGRF